jgi:hypothetical protein
MAGKGGARPNAGRPRKHIKFADLIKNHCQDFIIELLKDKDILKRCEREVQQFLDFKDIQEKKEDYIYIIKSNGLYKIGYTSNLKSRLNDYRVHFGLIELIYVYKGFDCYDLETIVHNLVKEKNHNGEWFNLCDDDIFQIIKYCSSLIN